MKYTPAWYASPINLPERTVGKFSVKHHIVKGETPVVGTRQAYTRGTTPLMAKLKEPLRVHELYEEGHGLWMTDLPEELNQIEEMLYDVKPQGRVLVGGLGLGLVAGALIYRPGVTNVTVVERSKPVIDLVLPTSCKTLTDKLLRDNTVCSDIMDYITQPAPIPFDFYLLDTWCGTNEMTWWETVLPLRRAIRQRWGRRPVVHCWAEDIMLGQVRQALVIDGVKHQMLELHNADLKKRGKKPLPLQACRRWYYKHFPVDFTEAEADWFLKHIGTKAWEKKYGVMIDKTYREMKGDHK